MCDFYFILNETTKNGTHKIKTQHDHLLSLAISKDVSKRAHRLLRIWEKRSDWEKHSQTDRQIDTQCITPKIESRKPNVTRRLNLESIALVDPRNIQILPWSFTILLCLIVVGCDLNSHWLLQMKRKTSHQINSHQWNHLLIRCEAFNRPVRKSEINRIDQRWARVKLRSNWHLM